jgi:HPt (histidine-containing phosphotransfer) domain-containing protein
MSDADVPHPFQHESPFDLTAFEAVAGAAGRRIVDPAADEATEPMPLPHYLPDTGPTLDPDARATRRTEIDNDHGVDAEGLTARGWVRDAPTLQSVIDQHQGGSDRYNSRMFAERPAEFYGVSRDESVDTREVFLVEHAEDDAAYDLVHKMLEVEKVLGELMTTQGGDVPNVRAAIEQAHDVRENLRVIGQEDLNEACHGIADHWLQLLDSGDRDLFIGIRFTTDSSSYFYTQVMDQLQTLIAAREDAANVTSRIHPLNIDDTPSDELKRQVQDGHFVAVDDWTITARQMEAVVNEVRFQYELSPSNMEIDLICAASDQLAVGINGVAVKGYFKRPSPADDESEAGVTGLQHGPTDFGFRHIIDSCYALLRQVPGYENYPYPILYSTARPYRTPRYAATDYSGNGAALASARQQHAAYVADLGQIDRPS